MEPEMTAASSPDDSAMVTADFRSPNSLPGRQFTPREIMT